MKEIVFDQNLFSLYYLIQIYLTTPLINSFLSPQAMLPSKVGFIVDSHTTANFELMKRFIFNVARMFRLEGSKFSIVQFGKTPSKVITQEKEVRILK